MRVYLLIMFAVAMSAIILSGTVYFDAQKAQTLNKSRIEYPMAITSFVCAVIGLIATVWVLDQSPPGAGSTRQ